MIRVRQVAELELSAASGLVLAGPFAWVVADDEHHLDRYLAETGARAERLALPFEGELPGDHAERKRLKPDLESLAALPDGRLLALGSGSTARRERAALLPPPASAGAPGAAPKLVDLSPLYAGLRARFPDLNIEGAAAAGEWLRLLQRGNGEGARNAVIDLDLAAALRALDRGGPLTADLVRFVRPVSLPALDGVPLAFTDATPFAPGSGRTLFAAAAEATDNPYDDGACAGSALGLLDAEGRVEWCEPLEGRHKIEGIAVASGGRVLLVADPDSREHRAPLLEVRLPL